MKKKLKNQLERRNENLESEIEIGYNRIGGWFSGGEIQCSRHLDLRENLWCRKFSKKGSKHYLMSF